MRRLVIMAMMLLGMSAYAQEDNALPEKTQKIIRQIEDANANVSTVCGRFLQTKKIFANGRSVNSEGMLYYACPECFAMYYDHPAGDRMIIGGNMMSMVRGKKENVYNLEKNAAMRSLSNILLLSMQGRILEIAHSNDADISVSDGDSGIKVTLSSRQKGSKGYSMIELTYQPGGVGLYSMTMVEFNGNTTVYTIDGMQFNAPVDERLFQVQRSGASMSP